MSDSVFVTSGLVKDVIDEAPAKILQISYNGKVLNPGDNLTPTEVKDVPTVTYDASPDTFYTLINHDPDAPSRADPKFGEFQHWVKMNIPGNDVNKGEEMTAYIGSGAPKGTGLHRYLFLLYKQTNGKIDTSVIPSIPNNTAEGRRSQKAREWASKYNLELVAGNFYLAEWDEYVPTLHAQLGFGK
ncbi:Phosphatidylethanolamine-binding protein 1 [Mactra antiquata]